MYWWLKTTYEGRPLILGPYGTEQLANEFGFKHFGADFEAYELPTRDKSRATAMIKARILQQTSNLDTALQKVRHKLPDKEGIITTDTLGSIIAISAILILLGVSIWWLCSSRHIRWSVVMKDGIMFVGERRWWREGFFELAFEVVR